MNLELIDNTALISGSTKGIGFAIASQLAAEGARVIVNGRSETARRWLNFSRLRPSRKSRDLPGSWPQLRQLKTSSSFFPRWRRGAIFNFSMLDVNRLMQQIAISDQTWNQTGKTSGKMESARAFRAKIQSA
jgi:NAD(P)-dependent dehydrogenase (short-subunit alcohol dehydrogenase family)